MELKEIHNCIIQGHYKFSLHASIEAESDGLDFAQILVCIQNGKILENYPDTGRGESCLVVGFSGSLPIHVVCSLRAGQVIIVTVYIPGPPNFIDPWTRTSAK